MQTIMDRNQVVDLARKACTDHATNDAWVASWNRVINHIEPLFKRKGIKSFEVTHILAVTREAFLRSAVEGKDLDDCEQDAINSICK